MSSFWSSTPTTPTPRGKKSQGTGGWPGRGFSNPEKDPKGAHRGQAAKAGLRAAGVARRHRKDTKIPPAPPGLAVLLLLTFS